MVSSRVRATKNISSRNTRPPWVPAVWETAEMNPVPETPASRHGQGRYLSETVEGISVRNPNHPSLVTRAKVSTSSPATKMPTCGMRRRQPGCSEYMNRTHSAKAAHSARSIASEAVLAVRQGRVSPARTASRP
jgi:hypothetical protein